MGRRVIVGLSLLCALMFCAFAAQSASAATSGTTAFTCVPVETGATFADAHCDTAKAGGAGYVHEVIAEGTETAITGSNHLTGSETKDAELHTVKAGIKVKIVCKTVHSEGTLTNTKVGEKHHVGGKVTVKYTNCEATEPAGKCNVKEPITANAVATSWESGEEMGVEFKAEEGKPFTEITLQEKNKCGGLIGTYPVEGSVIGTPNNKPTGGGATLHFSANVGGQAAMQNLTFGGSEAQYTGTETVEMKNPTPTTGNAITLTTVK